MRRREGLALAEGPRVVREALQSGARVRWVLAGAEWARATEAGRAIASLCRVQGVEMQLADDAEVAALISTERSPPVTACVVAPPPEPGPLVHGRFLMPVGVQIPGNLGALIRSAWAFGLDGVLVGPRVVDPWNPKVIRASAGGVFHMPLIAAPSATGDGDAWSEVNLLCADAGGTPAGRRRGAPESSWVLAVGGETSGLPAEMTRRARSVAVPMAAGADSLNVAVAGSILMHLLTAERRGT